MVDITSLKENSLEFNQLVSDLKDKYKCDWDDSVHDSYAPFVNRITENAKELSGINSKAEIIVKEVRSLNINQLVKNSNRLTKEVHSV